MSGSSDPSIHRQREVDFIRHVESLLQDDRLRVDTTRGRRPVTSLVLKREKSDRTVELKRTMSEMNRPDRELQNQMPVGETLDITLSQRRFKIFTKTVGRLKVICVSPTRALIAGESAAPLKTAEVQKVLSEMPPAGGVPSTVVLMSTSGFSIEAHELAVRRADRTVVMVEPNNAGGWAVFGPVETKALVDLFDPEADDSKRSRLRAEIESSQMELSGSGIASDRLAAKTQLPLPWVETELKSHAKETGLVAKRLDGRVVLFRAGNSPASKGADMPLIDRIKTLFARKGETEKKIAFLAERRTALSQQRDRSYEEMATLEQREGGLRQQFKESTADLAKRRITSQLLQLRKDIERRQQLLSVLNQQINVVSTHLHSLELVQQGSTAKLAPSEEIAEDAAKAEEMLAQLEADSELVTSVGGIPATGLSAEEQALYEELERENAGPASAIVEPQAASPVKPQSQPTQSAARRAEAEPG